LTESDDTYEITPIRVGEFHGLEASVLTMGRDLGKKVTAPLVMFLVRNAERTVLVDCGGSDEAWSSRHHTRIVRPPEEAPEASLAALGVRVEELKTLALTHLHWDHCFNTALFPKADIYVQARELAYARDPLPPDYKFYEAAAIGLKPAWAADTGRMVEVEGDAALAPGIDLVSLPGHSPGFQGVLVKTKGGRCLIAGDCLGLSANWPESRNPREAVPSGVYASLKDYYQSFEKIAGICDHILPGHDPGLFEAANRAAGEGGRKWG
jgi:glyoxylase-like metal-dependent hydrolase (beta-lactamase superfamily II)